MTHFLTVRPLEEGGMPKNVDLEGVTKNSWELEENLALIAEK